MFSWSRCERKFGPLIAERQGGELSAVDAAALDRHLRQCRRCRAWEEDLRQLVQEVRQASMTGALAHPAPEDLAALSSGGAGLAPQRRAEIERHLDTCADCRAEWNVAVNWRPARMPAPARPVRPVSWGWFAAGVASAATVAAALFAVVLPRTAPRAIGARPALEIAGVPVQVRGAHHRAAASDATPLPVSASAEVAVIALTVEAAVGSALAIEVRDDAGELLAKTDLTLADPSGLLMFSVAVSSLPESAGEFRVRVAGTDESFRYPFRIERRGD